MLTVVILTFLAVFTVVTAVFLSLTAVRESPRTELKRRLRLMEKDKSMKPLPDDLRLEIIRETPLFERFLSHLPIIRNIENWLDHAGAKISAQKFCLLVAAAMLTGFVLTVILRRDYLLASLVALTILLLPYPVLLSLKQRRYDMFTEQLPDVLTMIARSIRAGHALSGSLELVGNELADPAGGLFKTAFEQQKLGLPVVDTLLNMTERIDSLDLRFFVMVISINSEVGGNLAEILDKLAETIRERLKIRRQVKVYTAQGRLSGYLLAILPVVTFLFINFLLPGYEDVLTRQKPGQYILALAALMQFTGFLFIRKIIKIRI